MYRWVLIYFKEFKYEVLKLIRTPIYSLSTIAFPVMFYLLFGVLMNHGTGEAHVLLARHQLASFGCYGVIGASLYGFGVSLAMERGLGWMDVKRATPMPPGAYLAAKLGMSLAFSAIVVLVLLVAAELLAGAGLDIPHFAAGFVVLVLGSLPFCAFGLAIGYLVKPSSAVAVVNLIYLPMSFLSGLWIPIDLLPHAIQRYAILLPPYHFAELVRAQLSWKANVAVTGTWGHVAVLAVFTLLCLMLARLVATSGAGQDG